MNLIKQSYTRSSATLKKNEIYVFTDNCDRTSGTGIIPDDSNYSKRFGKTGLKYPKTTSACIRGLDNAFPITTQKGYSPKGKENNNWNDDDFEEFKKIIDDDINTIKRACKDLKAEYIIFPSSGILNTNIAKITFERTPRLYEYIIKKEIELRDFEI